MAYLKLISNIQNSFQNIRNSFFNIHDSFFNIHNYFSILKKNTHALFLSFSYYILYDAWFPSVWSQDPDKTRCKVIGVEMKGVESSMKIVALGATERKS